MRNCSCGKSEFARAVPASIVTPIFVMLYPTLIFPLKGGLGKL